MADLSVKLDRIEKAVDRIRAKVKKPTEAIEEVATAVEEMGAGTGEQDIYKVSSIEERDSLNAKENDMCVVHSLDEFYCDGTKYGHTLIFPETIVVDNAITSSIMFNLKYGSANTRITYQVSKTSFTVRDYGNMATPYLARYTSTDGITYTRTTTVEEITYKEDITIYSGTFNAKITPFMKMKDITFDGIFTYSNEVWNYTNINIPTESTKIIPENKVYTNNGIITGTFPALTVDGVNEIGIALENIKDFEFVGSLFKNSPIADPEIYKFLLKLTYKNTATNVNQLFQGSNLTGEIDLSDLDITNVTGISNMFNGVTNVTKIIMPKTCPTALKVYANVFQDCSSLEYIDMSNINFVDYTINGQTQNYLTQTFKGCSKLKFLDARSFMFSKLTGITASFEEVPTDCLIIVKDETQKSSFLANFSTFTNVKTVAEYEG